MSAKQYKIYIKAPPKLKFVGFPKIKWKNLEKYTHLTFMTIQVSLILFNHDYYLNAFFIVFLLPLVSDFDCILTNLNLIRVDKGKFKLPQAEKERTDSILKRALAVEKGDATPPSLTEEHPDGCKYFSFSFLRHCHKQA